MITPHFSIIIPTLDEEKYLPKLLDDLRKQKEHNFEVLIIDCSSQDKTINVAEKYRKLLTLKIFKKEKKNVSLQRNYGAKKAKGEYLIFLDADSRVTDSFTKNLKKVALKRKGLVFIPHIVPDESFARSIFKIINFLVELSQNTNTPFSTGGSMIWDRCFFLKIKGFNEKLYVAEDHNIIKKAAGWGVKAKFLPQIKIRFSLRRMKKEGRLTLFYKLILITAHILIKGDVRDKIVEYEMGGARYKNLKKPSFEENLRSNIEQINQFFKKYLFES
jgi:glycosyltransferase involved in cell wall biosynthesis